jgi:thiol-disulfide isomerase/thioredoxin
VSRSDSQSGKDAPSGFHRSRSALLFVSAAVMLGVAPYAAHAAESSVAAPPVLPAPTDQPPPPAAPAAGPDREAARAATPGERPSLTFRNFVDKDFVEARKGEAPIVLYFEADWCEPCKEMHARTFREPAVLEAAAGMELFRFDMTRSDGYVDIMKNSFQVIGAPTVIVFAPGGKEVARRFGFIPPADFAEMLAKAREPRRPPASS